MNKTIKSLKTLQRLQKSFLDQMLQQKVELETHVHRNESQITQITISQIKEVELSNESVNQGELQKTRSLGPYLERNKDTINKLDKQNTEIKIAIGIVQDKIFSLYQDFKTFESLDVKLTQEIEKELEMKQSATMEQLFLSHKQNKQKN